MLSFFWMLTACNNINPKHGLGSSLVSQSDPFASSNAGDFVLSSLAPDPTSPGTIIDFIGSNSQFDTYCSSTASPCMCEYTFLQAGVGTQTVSVANVYKESNMLRCPNNVPSGVTSFQARVVVNNFSGTQTTATPSQATTFASNYITGSFSNGALSGTSSYVDLTNLSAYVPVKRFQCRRREYIDNPLSPGMIDPFQTQNPAVVYPFNYYTTNAASSILHLQRSADQSWECSLNATQDHSVQWWANPNVYSTAPCTTSFCLGDGSLIYPQTSLTSGMVPVTNPTETGKTRGSFYLASQSYSVFGVAVVAAVAPSPSAGNVAASASSTPPPGTYTSAAYSTIGYGAKSIANTGGSSSCPAIPLPPKSRWVKLWNFRATDITPAKKVVASTSASQSAIACDTFHPDTTHTALASELFPSCERNDPNNIFFGVPLNDGTVTSAAPTRLASRVIASTVSGTTSATSACYNFATSGAGHNYLADMPWTSNVNYNGMDVWVPSPYKFDTTISVGTIAGFPWNMYQNASSYPLHNDASTPNNQWFQVGGAYAVPSATPMDFSTQLSTISLSADNYTDQIFVVTDTAVSDDDMRNGASNVQQYVPRTFRSAGDCTATSPSDPSCAGKTQITWGIQTQQIGSTSGTDVYPLCVLQFYD